MLNARCGWRTNKRNAEEKPTGWQGLKRYTYTTKFKSATVLLHSLQIICSSSNGCTPKSVNLHSIWCHWLPVWHRAIFKTITFVWNVSMALVLHIYRNSASLWKCLGSSMVMVSIDCISVLQAPLYLRTLWCYVSVFLKIILILTSLYLVEGLAWWDWPFTWWTDQLLSFSAWHCWLSHLTCKNRPQYDL